MMNENFRKGYETAWLSVINMALIVIHNRMLC